MLNTDLCKCGSGLRALRCCEADRAALPGAASLELLNGQAAEATKLYNEKKPRDAATLALKILDLAPNHRMALRVLYEVRKSENQAQATEALARRLAELPAENAAQTAAAHLQLAQLLIAQGRHKEAEAPARAAVKLSPRDPNAHHVIGVIFTETGQLRQGERHYRQALEFRGQEDGLIMGNLAWNLRQQGLLDEAAGLYERSLASRPENRRAIGGFAQVEAGRGNFAHAAALLDRGLALQPPDRSLRLLRAMLALRQNDPQAVLNRLNDPAEALVPAELLLRGQALLRLGQTGEAIAAFIAARQMQRDRFGQHYRPAAAIETSAKYKAFFTVNRLAPLPRAPGGGLRPVFLLGFPGSGTSLLEQLLAQIPGIAAADEFAPIAGLLALPELTNYPDCLTDMLIGERQYLPGQLSTRYVEQLRQAGIAANGENFVTLRAAGNAWHLGLIKLLFPEAPVIHLIRHPLDIVANNFARDKKLEANAGVSLTGLAQHYDLTMSLIQHYRGQLTLRYLPVHYEKLVSEPGQELRRILEFIGAPGDIPDELTLRGNAVKPAVRYPGHVTGQQPVDARNVFQHLNFESAAPDLFAEIRPILTPWITELGYAA